MSQRQLTIREMQDIIVEAYKVDPRQNLGFRGTPGIGKTEGVYGASDVLSKTWPNWAGARVMILSQLESVDMRMPFIYDNDKYKFLAHDDLKWPADARGILFLDEAANAQQDVLKAMQQILSDRKLGDISIPDGIMIIIASNNKSDRAGVNSIPTAFANRIEWHQVGSDHEQWIEDYAYPRGIDVAITSYIKKFPPELNNFNPEKEVNATPRTWSKLSKVMSSNYFYDRCSGLIGEEMATKFVAWRKNWEQFPEPEDILKDPEKAKLPKAPDAQFALVCAMSVWVGQDRCNWSPFFQYVERLNLEYQMLYMKESTRANPKMGFKDTPEYSKWIVKHQGKIIG